MSTWVVVKTMIETKGICKSFGPLVAVDQVSLRVREGDLFGLVGPDGAGKTTLMRMICGLINPTAGSVQVSTQGNFGYMPQKFSLYGDLTVMENINFFGAMYGLKKGLITQRAEEILSTTNLLPFKNRFADNLSGGMKQKLALTCALISRPRLLVLDEPTFGVDPESRKEFWKILYQLNKEGMTILVSTPYMDEAELCRRVGFMNEGKLVAEDSPSQLKRDFPYAILEVRVQSRDPELFSDLEEVLDASVYGDKYRLVVEDAHLATQAIRTTLVSLGVTLMGLEQGKPSMEDVFAMLAERGVA